MTDVPHPAVPEPNPAQLARGREIGELLDLAETELRGWMETVGRATPELVDAGIHGDRALTALQQARVEVDTFTMIAASSS